MCILKSSATDLLLLSLFALLNFASEAAPIYSVHDCTPGSYYRPNTTFQTNLNVLLSSLVSNATLHDGFYRTNISLGSPNEVKGLFLCRGDVTPSVCHDCVTTAAKNITYRCTNQTQSIIWYDECMLRYSNSSTLSNTDPGLLLINVQSVPDSDHTRFNDILASTLNGAAGEAANSPSGKKFATKEANFTNSTKLYTLAQCTPDLSTSDCNSCFSRAISTLPNFCDGKQGARVLFPACNIRYELYPFYNVPNVSTQPQLLPPSSGKSSVPIIVAIVVPIVVAMVLIIVGVCFLRKQASKKHITFVQDSSNLSFTVVVIVSCNFFPLTLAWLMMITVFLFCVVVNDLTDEEFLQFDLATVEAATNGFSDENKIGQGGFGVVYKGVLPNGQEIAVKRLSVTSLQGAVEFRNEAALVAKLQHRNLVRLLGFCLEGKEKILIYEYMPNKSLDHFLFDPVKQRELDWSRRYKIIVGIARGILYLHQDSQLRIIHRDLKASNVLLDENMNSKISDFGMAKIFQADETQVNTGRIVGTYGYMSPEYAMRGQFSVKSDVFSFGVLVLEIVSGKKNTDFYQSNRADDLLSHAWKNWTEQTPLELLDPTLRGSYSRNEVTRCIHIGLLCVQENPSDRPSMATIALMLNSYSVTLSMPRQPPSFLRGRSPNRLNRGLDSDQSITDRSTSHSIPWSYPLLKYTLAKGLLFMFSSINPLYVKILSNYDVTVKPPLALFSLFCVLILASESAPTYSAHYCTNQTFYQPNTTFGSNLNALLSSLTSNSSLRSNDGFYRTAVGQATPDVVNGLFLCRGDVNATICHGCVAAAATNITRLCPTDKEAIIWYDMCMLRYSSSTFNNIVPGIPLNDEGSVQNSNRDAFNKKLAELLNDLAEKASASSVLGKKFAAGDVGFASSQTLYGMAQCVPELTGDGCGTCFRSAIASLPTCCDGSEGARVLLPACNIRYQLYPFLYNTTSTMPLAPFPSSGSKSTLPIVAIVVPIGVLVALLVLGCCWWRRRRNKKHDAVLELNYSTRSDFLCEEESLHFDLATIEAATCRFSNENKIGEGGFGAVYKKHAFHQGTLPNGQEIAVKRLSKRSLQGDIEFKNEATLVAQLQHRNLVRLIGFCLERTERILVYEFVPNSSLDHFLFDHENQGELDWARRYKIIAGIARGIQYLHEDSRLRIIHRDLKASNILLDFDMNPKISDFGMAKIFHDDQSQVNTATKRIVGTYGYMSPEYAMHGKFSVKSDVFSFGVLVLEILSGKKNTSYYQSHQDDDLLSFAWKNWTNQTPFVILDPKLRGSYSRNEVRRCIHIALLCVQENPGDRPSIATIMLALNSYSVTLALPRQPASFLRGRTTPDRSRHQLESDRSTSSTIPFSYQLQFNMLASKFRTTLLALECLFCMVFHASESAQIYSAHYCTNRTFYQPNTTFESNLNTLLSSLTSNSSLQSNNGFYRTSVERDTPNDIDGLFLCRGDVNATVCHGCVAAAATNITRLCPNDTESIIWYDVCMLSYSNSTFDNDNIVPGFSLKDEGNPVNSNRDQFNQLLASLLNSLEAKAAASAMPGKKFAAGEVSLSSTQTLYGMAQCLPDLTSDGCVTCCRSAIASLPTCCDGSQGAKVLLPACNIRYQLYPFLYNTTSVRPLVPFPSSGGSWFLFAPTTLHHLSLNNSRLFCTF
ncbi:Cysteine-rich receptor-like protein kinase 25, partial [Mucuna pruriens]